MLAAATYTLTVTFDVDEPARVAWSFGVPLTLGFGKEAFDAARGSYPSHADLVWDVVGTSAGFGIAWLVHQAVRSSATTRDEREGPERGYQLLPAHGFRSSYFFEK